MKHLPDLFDYAGNGLIGKFISPVYFSNTKKLVESFYKDPTVLNPMTSFKDYYIKVRNWLEEYLEECAVIRPFALVAKDCYMVVMSDSIIIGYDDTLLKLQASYRQFPKDPLDISAVDDEALEKYLKLVK